MSWFSKKQNCVALSTAECEYIAAGSCVAQILWIKQKFFNFEITFSKIPIKCDDTSAINIFKNPIQQSKTNHIDIKHHCIRDRVLNGDMELKFVSTTDQLADILTKSLDEKTFVSIRRRIGMCDLNEFLLISVHMHSCIHLHQSDLVAKKKSQGLEDQIC